MQKKAPKELNVELIIQILVFIHIVSALNASIDGERIYIVYVVHYTLTYV